MSAPSAASTPGSGVTAPTTSSATTITNKHALSASERQRAQLDKLLKDPAKPAFIPAAPKEKTLRPAREMMKNVQGSSAGAGSGEFHVYKASRRREYERLKMMEEESARETEVAEFEKKKAEREQTAEAKTAKNRAKRDKKKAARKKAGDKEDVEAGGMASTATSEAPLKKRRLVNGTELVFKRPGEDSDDDDEGGAGPMPAVAVASLAFGHGPGQDSADVGADDVVKRILVVSEEARIVIHDD